MYSIKRLPFDQLLNRRPTELPRRLRSQLRCAIYF